MNNTRAHMHTYAHIRTHTQALYQHSRGVAVGAGSWSSSGIISRRCHRRFLEILRKVSLLAPCTHVWALCICACDLVIFPCSGGPVCYTTRHLTPIRIITRGRVCAVVNPFADRLVWTSTNALLLALTLSFHLHFLLWRGDRPYTP